MGEFQRWLLARLNERNLSAREASLQAGLNHGAMSYYLEGHRPSIENCRKIARLFGVPVEIVLMLNGYMAKPQGYDEFVAQITELTQDWSDDQKARLLRLVRELVGQIESMQVNEQVRRE